jgi:hypothetical protein
MVNGEAGKGDSPRKIDFKSYRNKYDKIFTSKPPPKKDENKRHKDHRKKG